MTPDDLTLRQQRLLVRSAELRLTMAQEMQVLQRPLALADRVYRGIGWLGRNPQWPAGILLALCALRPQRAIQWGKHLWWVWAAVRQLRPMTLKSKR